MDLCNFPVSLMERPPISGCCQHTGGPGQTSRAVIHTDRDVQGLAGVTTAVQIALLHLQT